MIRKTLLSLVALATMTLTACGPSPQQQQQQAYNAGMAAGAQQQAAAQQVAAAPSQQQSYASIQECQSDPNNPYPNLCAASFNEAQAALPHYYSASSCDAMGYTCQNYGGWWGPAFAGFMLGSYMNGGYHPYPVYIGSGGYLYGNGYSLGYRPNRVYVNGSYHYVVAPHTTFVIHSTPTTVYRTAVPAAAYAHPISAPPPPVRVGGLGATGAQAQLNSQTRPAGPAAIPATAAARPAGAVVGIARPGATLPVARPVSSPSIVSAPRPSIVSAPRPAVVSISRPSGSTSYHSGGGGGSRHH